jgi:hypothetical protein
MLEHRHHAPATLRNREPILALLREVLPASGLVLEIASGSGEHGVHFARALPGVSWQPSDPAEAALQSIAAWREVEGTVNLLPPLELDAGLSNWPITEAQAIVCINMIHISPWSATQGLMRGAERLLAPGAPLVLYGPFLRRNVPLASSNAEFDADLKARDPRFGLRDLDVVSDLALAHGLELDRIVEMPANNLGVVFRRS